jgi:hypothetical protein
LATATLKSLWRRLMASRYLYHATLDENLGSIHKKGLKPVEDTSQCHWGGNFANDCLGRTYLTSTPEMAVYYGEIIQRGRAEQDCGEGLDEDDLETDCVPEIMLLRVPVGKIKDAQPDRETAGDFFIKRTIPPSDIDFLRGDYCWQPLAKANPGTIEAVTSGEWREPLTGEVDLRMELANRKKALVNLAKLCARKRK